MFRWTGMAVQKARFGKGREASGRKYLSPILRVKPRRVALIGVKDTPQVGNPRPVFVADVPDEPEYAVRLQDPVDFLERLCTGEPVKGLRADDGINGGVGKRNGLCGALLRFDARMAISQLLKHGRHGLYGNDGRFGMAQVRQELSRA